MIIDLVFDIGNNSRGVDFGVHRKLTGRGKIHSQRGHAFFLLPEPDSTGSTPQRTPPSVETNYDKPHSSILLFFSNGGATVSGYDLEANRSHTVPSSSKSGKKTHAPSIGLPALRTGISWPTF
ncbi:hypothetical protein E3N88_09577 [Mikania micrantha]|uniref:Uncharacterized protein n=1 Tax=Mikania micrantha TaxID=192012 RepID=A0A5N6PLE5_9ASTR|nr:hypothetical protein E3N88_09577 [Mikania micrantha]